LKGSLELVIAHRHQLIM